MKIKKRDWEAYISIAASGDDAGDNWGPVYPKEFSRLKYTSRDIDYWADWWKGERADPPAHDLHIVRHDAEYASVQAAFDEAGEWLTEASEDPAFDGGSIVFCYSGHGREGDGALCLNQGTFFDAQDFISACLAIRKASPGKLPLRIGLILDSCYSGAFLLNVLEKFLHQYNSDFYPDYFYAASMPDEQAWEVSSVEHGLATHSRVLQTARDFDQFMKWPYAPGDENLAARDLAVGESGCAYVTAAAQNPVIFDEHDLQTGQEKIEVWTGYDFDNGLRPRKDWECELFDARDRFRASLVVLHGGEGFKGGELFDPTPAASLRLDYLIANPKEAARAYGVLKPAPDFSPENPRLTMSIRMKVKRIVTSDTESESHPTVRQID